MLHSRRQSFLNTKIFVAVPAVLVSAAYILFVGNAHAVASVSYDGCYERSTTGISSILWLKQPVCTITIANPAEVEDTYLFTLLNLDPQAYKIEYADQTPLEATRTDEELIFTPTLPASSTTTLTVSPWDYDATTTDFWFAAISDPQNQSGGSVPNSVFVDLIGDLENIAPPFVTVSGDIIRGDASSAENHQAEYELYDNTFTGFIGSSFPVPGNHDRRQDLDTYYTSYFGERSFTFTYGANTRFIGMSSVESAVDGEITTETWEWLETQLEAATEEHLIVYLHHPLVLPDWSSSPGIKVDQRQDFAELMVEHDVELIIVGDAHGYDFRNIGSDEFHGLTGNFDQLITGGAGGRNVNYGGDYFLTLVHVEDDGITPYRLDRSAIGLSVAYSGANDGTQSELTVDIFNDGEVDIPWYRVPVHLDAGENVYASLGDGTFIPFTTTVIDGVAHGALEFTNLATDSAQSITFKERTNALTGITNPYSKDGTLVFNELPTSENSETTLSVKSAQRAGSIEVTEWNTETGTYKWTETAGKADAWTQFEITALQADREYNVLVDGKVVNRVFTDENGLLSFKYTGKKKPRAYELQLENRVVPTNIGVLPSAAGGANFQLFGDAGDKVASFFSHGTDLTAGFESLWADIDGDRKNELLVVPAPGTAGHVRAFERGGKFKADFFPFGKTYKAGVNMVAGDLDANGRQEVVVTAREGKVARVKVYSYRENTNSFKLVHSFRTFAKTYKGGVNLATGDLNNDGDDEIIVGARSKKANVKVYKWKRKKQEAAFWLKAKPFKGEAATQGFSIATGDVNIDGKDEVIVGSYTGGGTVRVYKHNTAKTKMKRIKGRRVFPKGFDGGVNILVGNINNTAKDEILVSARDSALYGGRIKAFTAKKAKRLKSLKGFKPFGSLPGQELSYSLADLDSDWKMEIVTAKKEEGNQIRVYKRIGKIFQQTDKYAIYSSVFDSGLSLTQ